MLKKDAKEPQIKGFKLVNIYNLDEYRSTGYEFIHTRTGLKVFHIYNDDEENTFSFSFNTPVDSSNGVPHIIEHSVLSGSRRYNLKDPFQAMMSGSVNTFLNAYTFPDKTSYPASSVLEKDFFNLMSVYADAVFFPNLTKKTFMQEGWRLCVDDNDNLFYSGVVYNEMKGVYSSHDSVVADMSVKSLFSNGTYTHDSGGNPEDIPNLTYEEFVSYHKKWYRPDNCYLYLYGNIPTEKSLTFLDENFLKDCKSLETSNSVSITSDSELWDNPREFHKTTPALEGDSSKGDLLISWKLFNADNPEEAISLEVLHKILLGNSGSPLYKALAENEEWDDLSSATGLENELCNFIYTVGVRGATPDKMELFRNCLLSTLEGIVNNGLDPDTVEGALRGIEFKNREIHGSLGLRLMRKVIRGWLHGYSPISTLEFEKHMNSLRHKCKEPGYFEGLIKKYLLDNKNRADITVEPDYNTTLKQKSKLEERLKNLKASLKPSQLEIIKRDNKELEDYQNTPDSKEELEKLPRLKKDDISHEVINIDTIKSDISGYDFYKTYLYTNDIVYFGIGFNMEYLDKFFFEYLLIFSRMFTSTGYKDKPYDEVAKLVSLNLGGLGTSLETSNTLKNGRPDYYIENLFVRGKSLIESLDESMNIVIDFFNKADFHDYKRLKNIIIELRNDIKSALIPNGSSYAALRSARKFSLASCREECWYGVTQAQFLDNLVKEIENESKLVEVATILDGIKGELVTRKGLFFHASADKKYEKQLIDAFKRVIDSLPDGDSYIHSAEHYDIHNSIEALVGNTQVSYSGVTVKGAFIGTKEYATQEILCYLLKTGYLWENVRMKGGAYGVFVSGSGMDGSITFGSYRDPNITGTLEHFKQSLEWIAAGHLTEEEIELALISVIGKELKPLTPIEKSIIGMRRKLIGITDEIRINKRNNLLSVTKEDLMDFAAVILHHFSDCSTVVMASEDHIKEASQSIPELSENLVILPS